jgi:hypothetical protein
MHPGRGQIDDGIKFNITESGTHGNSIEPLDNYLFNETLSIGATNQSDDLVPNLLQH